MNKFSIGCSTNIGFTDSNRASISPEKHIHAYLWFAGHQAACFADVADRFDLAISSLHAVTLRVTDFLCGLAPQVIHWPTPVEKAATMAYYGNKGFPGAIGVYLETWYI